VYQLHTFPVRCLLTMIGIGVQHRQSRHLQSTVKTVDLLSTCLPRSNLKRLNGIPAWSNASDVNLPHPLYHALPTAFVTRYSKTRFNASRSNRGSTTIYLYIKLLRHSHLQQTRCKTDLPTLIFLPPKNLRVWMS
jgi:hypothetical protein